MIKFIVCEDRDTDLATINKTIVKAMMQYNTDYKIVKFKEYDSKLKEIINSTSDVKIYLIDIELPGKGGLEIASEIRNKDLESKIVFITSHPECKNDIFYSRLQAIDYITKGIFYERRLEETLEYIVESIFKENILNISYNHVQSLIILKEINYIEKVPNESKCIIHLTTGEEKYCTATIAKLKSQIGTIFFQTHKACLVNVCNIRKIDYANFTIYFKNGDNTNLLTVASRKELKKHVNRF